MKIEKLNDLTYLLLFDNSIQSKELFTFYITHTKNTAKL